MLSELVILSFKNGGTNAIRGDLFLSSSVKNVFWFRACWWKVKFFTFWWQLVKQLLLAKSHFITCLELIRYFPGRRHYSRSVIALSCGIWGWSLYYWQICWASKWFINVFLLLFLFTILIITIQRFKSFKMLWKSSCILLFCT